MEEIESDVARNTLLGLRTLILKTVPDAQEVISYGIPSYKYNKTMVSFAAFKKHCSFFPGSILDEFQEEIKDYKTSRGTIQFPHDKPLPDELVRSILFARFKL